jgi:hypothetical protein
MTIGQDGRQAFAAEVERHRISAVAPRHFLQAGDQFRTGTNRNMRVLIVRRAPASASISGGAQASGRTSGRCDLAGSYNASFSRSRSRS